MKKEAIKLHKHGFKIIPTNDPSLPDGKKPLCAWKKYQEKQTLQEVESLFSKNNVGGMALLTADGIEVIDVDLKYALDDNLLTELLDKIIDAIGIETYEKLILSKTISGGYHIIYRTNIPGGNQKLAQRYTLDSEKKGTHDNIRVLLETRGVGGYIMVPPTAGYEYDSPQKTITEVYLVTDDERNSIINACKIFDETNAHFKNTTPTPVEVVGTHKTTIEAFNEAHTPKEFLENHGWQYKYQRGENLYYVRPGKNKNEGIGACYHEGKKLAFVFTSSTEFEPEKAYNAFQVYSYLEHNGDFKKSAKVLYDLNYGDRLSKNRDTYYESIININESTKKDSELSLWDRVYPLKFSINNVPDAIDHLLYFNNDPLDDLMPMAAFGDLIMITGAAKSRKSALSNSIVAALLSDNKEVLNFSGDVKGRDIVIIDTEQNKNDFYKSLKQVYHQAGIPPGIDPPNLHAFPICHLSIKERMEFVTKELKNIKDMGVLLLDGIVDICEDYNDQRSTRALLNVLMRITRDNNTLFLPVLHTARSTGSARGHLGNELLNKCKITLKVTKNKEEKDSTVEFAFIRGSADPDNFNFTHDSNGNLIII